MSDDALRERVSAPPRWRKWLGGQSDGSLSQSASSPDGHGVLAVHHLGVRAIAAERLCTTSAFRCDRARQSVCLGPNGAGKTTVFYMITGLVKPDKGEIELDGHNVTGLPMFQRARLGVGYLPQEASIFRGLNVEDNIRAVLEVNEPNRRAREAMLEIAARGV